MWGVSARLRRERCFTNRVSIPDLYFIRILCRNRYTICEWGPEGRGMKNCTGTISTSLQPTTCVKCWCCACAS